MAARATLFHWLTIGLSVLIAYSSPAAFAEAMSASDASLTVEVHGVAPKGIVRLGIYTKDTYPDDKSEPVAGADVAAQPGLTTITIPAIAPGEYAIEVYQDLNSNGKMDTTLLGIPEEPYGFSRDARPRLAKPPFARVKFVIAAGANIQILHLQNVPTVVAAK